MHYQKQKIMFTAMTNYQINNI